MSQVRSLICHWPFQIYEYMLLKSVLHLWWREIHSLGRFQIVWTVNSVPFMWINFPWRVHELIYDTQDTHCTYMVSWVTDISTSLLGIDTLQGDKATALLWGSKLPFMINVWQYRVQLCGGKESWFHNGKCWAFCWQRYKLRPSSALQWIKLHTEMEVLTIQESEPFQGIPC